MHDLLRDLATFFVEDWYFRSKECEETYGISVKSVVCHIVCQVILLKSFEASGKVKS